MPEYFLAALAGACSAGALEVLRHLLAHSQQAASKSVDDAIAFRQDLLARIEGLEQELTRLTQERDEWQERFYREREARIQPQVSSWHTQQPDQPADEAPSTKA